VKLGTITPHGADAYSYAPDEDDMVTDPLLGDHLAHWGINMLQVRCSRLASVSSSQNRPVPAAMQPSGRLQDRAHNCMSMVDHWMSRAQQPAAYFARVMLTYCVCRPNQLAQCYASDRLL